MPKCPSASESASRQRRVESQFHTFTAFYFGPMPSLLSELFPIAVCSTGMIAYSLGVAIFGSFAPLILTALVSATGEITIPSFHYAACSLRSFIGVIVARKAYQQL